MGAAGGNERAIESLRRLLGEDLDVTDAVRGHHGRDESPLPDALPDAVAFARSTERVSEILKVCSEHSFPVVPFGAGTSLEGHALPVHGGLSLDLTKMDRILQVNVDDLDVTVQAGVTKNALNDHLRPHGLFFPVDPGADATLGGMAATGASGTTTVRYGAMKENVLSLEVVLADGTVTRTGARARKTAAGYDLTHLFVGSEGTLGVITEITLKLYGIPEVISGALASFPDVESAVGAVITVLQLGVPVARIELMDPLAIEASNAYSGTTLPEVPTLFLEFHGSARGVEEQMASVEEVARAAGAIDLRKAIDNKERTELLRARHESFYACLALKPGSRAVTTDVCVPISALPDCISETRADVEELGLVAPMVGHVGDGNFHVVVLVDPDDPAENDRTEEFNRRLVDRALKMDGTCTGEHGIGLRKIDSLAKELPTATAIMGDLKRTLDPAGIMNPGKMLKQ